MTVPGFGRITPIQGAMLELAGYNLDPSKCDFDPARPGQEQIPEADRGAIMQRGLRQLQRASGQDFGFDLGAWHEYLMSRPDLGYTHPHANATTRRFVEAAMTDPERQRIVAKIIQGAQRDKLQRR